MQTKISSDKLTLGMFVADLDCPWLDTPFLLQGFQIENEEHLQQLRHHCKSVVVDSEFSTPKAQTTIKLLLKQTSITPAEKSTSFPVSEPSAGNLPTSFIPEHIKLVEFKNVTPVENELSPAGEAFTRTTEVLNNLILDLRNDKTLAIEEVEFAIHDLVESMARNPYAIMLISRLRLENADLYQHGINVAIHLVALGRHLGLPKDMLEHLGILGLLLDVGKTKLPQELLNKHGRLTPDEFEVIKNHVSHCLNILNSSSALHPDILEGIAQHHERENGSGYPVGLSKGEISLFGRMAAIADTFSALTNPRFYAKTYSAYEALHTLTDWGKEFFHGPIVEQFTHAIGIFPIGTMTELSSGEIAIVISHNKVRRLKPRVLIISDKNKQPLPSATTLDLLHQPDTHSPPLTIMRGLPMGAYGLNPREYYLT